MARDRASIRLNLWADDDWRKLSREAQWAWLLCKAIGRGPFTANRLARKTGKCATEISDALRELSRSPYGAILRPPKYRRRLPRWLVEEVFSRDCHTCRHCGSRENLTIDHIWPVSRGGSDDIENLQTLCHSCNARKGARV